MQKFRHFVKRSYAIEFWGWDWNFFYMDDDPSRHWRQKNVVSPSIRRLDVITSKQAFNESLKFHNSSKPHVQQKIIAFL